MKAVDFQKHVEKLGTWVNYKNTTDYWHAGNPDTEVKGIAVCWQARQSALEQAVQQGCNMIVTHEQIEYPEGQVSRKDEVQPWMAAKLQYIKDNKLVIYRCHDMWDRFPRWGIVDSWADHLGLKNKLAANQIEAWVYPSPKPTLFQLAKYVLEKTRDLGQDSVEMIGDPNAFIGNVAIGCGAGTDFAAAARDGADAFIGTDDGIRHWEHGSWALDKGFSAVLVNHCTSEEPGMMNMVEYIKEQFGIKAVHIPQGCMYKTVHG